MHDTVSKIKRRITGQEPEEGVADLVSGRLQAGGLSRALSEPFSAHFELLYVGAFNWTRLVQQLNGGGDAAALFGEMVFGAKHLAMVLEDITPFLERMEDNLSEREEITHRESAYEREVAPFARLDSTREFKSFLENHPAFNLDLASQGAQAEADLLKVVYLEKRLRKEAPKPADLYAMVVELTLDGRRHLTPAFASGADFMQAMQRAAQG